MRSASSIILKLTLNYKTFEYLEWHSRVQQRWKLIILGKFHSQVIEQFVSNFHESHRSKYRFSDWTEAKRSGRINERRVQNKRQHLGLIAVPKKKKENYRKIQRPSWPAAIDIYRSLDLLHTRIAWIACTIIVIVNYTGWRTALIWGSELDFRVIRHVGSWI